MIIAARSHLDLENSRSTYLQTKNVLHWHTWIWPEKNITTESVFTTISGATVEPDTVMSASMAMTTSSARVTDTSSRTVSFFKQSSAVSSTTTNSWGINITKNSHNEFIKDCVEKKDCEHTSDDSSSPETEDTKGDGNNASENTRSPGHMATSTLVPDNMNQYIRTVGINIRPTGSAHQAYQTKA